MEANGAWGWAQSNVVPAHGDNKNIISFDIIPQKLILCSQLERPFVESCRLHCKNASFTTKENDNKKMTKQEKTVVQPVEYIQISYLQCL